MHHLNRTIVIAVLLVLGAVPVAMACSVGQAPPLGEVAADQVRVPARGVAGRAWWGLQPGWRSVRPTLTGSLVARSEDGSLSVEQDVAYAGQRNLKVSGSHPRGDLQLDHDLDEATPPCALAGQPAWTKPLLRTRQARHAVYLTFITRPTPGDRTGCRTILSSQAGASCDSTAFGSVRLDRALGDRRLVMQWFSA